MKHFLLGGMMCLMQLSGAAQHFGWVTSGGYVGPANSYYGSLDMAVDAEGNTYTLNDANDIQQCQGTTYLPTATSPTSYSMFIHKFNPEGELVWVQAVGEYMTPYAIEVDENQNVFVLARNHQSLFMIDEVSTPAVQGKYYIVKLNANGGFEWLYDTGTSNFGGATNTSLLHYAQGKLFFQQGNLGIGSVNASDAEGPDNVEADAYVPTTAFQNIWLKSAATFSNGDLLFAGEHRGKLTFAGVELPATQLEADKHRYFFLRCTPDLDIVWFKSYGSFARTGEYPLSLCVDNEDQFYSGVLVNHNETISFGADVLNNTTLVNGAGAIAKFDENGDPLWIKAITSAGSITPYGMVWKSDNSGLFACGTNPVDATFGTHTVVASSGSKGFIVEISADGDFIDAYSNGVLASPPNSFQSFCYAMGKDDDDHYFVSGMLDALGSWSASCQDQEANKGFFLMRFTGEDDVIPTPTISVTGAILSASPAFRGDIQWFLDGEEIDGASTATLVAVENGAYSVSYTSNEGCTGSASSATVDVVVISVNDTELPNFSVYPNPAEDMVWIKRESEIPARVEVRDITGALVYQTMMVNGSAAFSVAPFAQGIYTVRVFSEMGFVSSALIVQ